MEIFIFIVLIIAVPYKIISLYNNAKKFLIIRDEAQSNIIVLRKKRLDLMGQLFRLMKSYRLHEKGLLENISSSFGKGEDSASNSPLVSRIAALHMHFPEIKAQELFSQTMNSLERVELDIQKSRERVNKISGSYNELIAIFPNNYIAKMFSFDFVSYLDEASISIMDEELKSLIDEY